MDAEVLKLPEFSSSALWGLVYFLGAVSLILGIAVWRVHVRNRLHSLLYRFDAYLIRRGLKKNQREIALAFFQHLTEHEKTEIFISGKFFAERLHQYLEAQAQISANERVEIFDKFFPNLASKTEIRALPDLREGEICAIDQETRSFLGTFMRSKNNQALISFRQKHVLKEGEAKLYAYRPNLGGFLLSGKILKQNTQGLIFEHDGKIEFKGDQHLMCLLDMQVRFLPWPPPELKLDDAGEEVKHDTNDYSGAISRLSDRAFAFEFHNSIPGWILRRQELWSVTLKLDDKEVEIRGKIIQPKPGKNYYYFKFTDVDQLARTHIYEFITQHNPVREQFS